MNQALIAGPPRLRSFLQGYSHLRCFLPTSAQYLVQSRCLPILLAPRLSFFFHLARSFSLCTWIAAQKFCTHSLPIERVDSLPNLHHTPRDSKETAIGSATVHFSVSLP